MTIDPRVVNALSRTAPLNGCDLDSGLNALSLQLKSLYLRAREIVDSFCSLENVDYPEELDAERLAAVCLLLGEEDYLARSVILNALSEDSFPGDPLGKWYGDAPSVRSKASRLVDFAYLEWLSGQTVNASDTPEGAALKRLSELAFTGFSHTFYDESED